MIAQQLVNALMLSGIYALLGVAFTLAIGVLNFLNFSIPALFMLGGVLSCSVINKGVPFSASIAVVLVVIALLAIVVERFTYRWLKHSDHHVPLVSSLGFLILFESLVVVLFGSDAVHFPTPFGGASIRLGALTLSWPQTLGLALALVLVAGCDGFLKRTNLGRGLRSIAESPTTAEMLGVGVGSAVISLYIASGVLAATAGILFGVSYQQVSWSMGAEVGLKGICAMVLGGMGNVWGAVLGALLIGLTEVMTTAYGSSEAVNVIVYGLLLALIVLRPQGLLGDRAPLQERM